MQMNILNGNVAVINKIENTDISAPQNPLLGFSSTPKMQKFTLN